tara:strand:+ start:159 stop:569 length:411 start_codon:yes stop_codon:yes gene_type:complete
MREKTFLGIGWSFPPTFNKESSDVKMVSDETDIKESLEIYFNTKLGERIMRPSYGCVIHEHIFDKIDESILNILSFELTQNIGQIEPRIIVEKIEIKQSSIENGELQISIQYKIISSNVRDNIVFPFYINEGTNIK